MTPCVLKTRLIALAMVVSGSACASAEYLSVHVGYVVPSDRTAQASAADNLWESARLTQAWYAEQMDRWGFGPKTFRLNSFGATRVVTATADAATIRSDVWEQTIAGAQSGGLPIWRTGEVWFLAANAHQMQPNGEVQGGTALGASFGSDDDPGVAMLGGNAIPYLSLDSTRDDRAYNGLTLPEVGPFPLVQDVSHPWFERTTVSSVSSAQLGVMIHELGHAFGLPHTFLNDRNFDGPVMGNGLRGTRGVFNRDAYGADDTWLSYASALALSSSRYFDPTRTYTDNVKPSVTVTTAGAVGTTEGQLAIDFTASDPSGLSAAVLLRDGDAIAATPLDGTSVSTSFLTPYFDVGVTSEFRVHVYDTQGNRRDQTVNITPISTGNRAPQPFVDVSHTLVESGSSVRLDALRTIDPDFTGALTVEWDLDGDGAFEFGPSSSLVLNTSLSPGTYSATARITDGLGASSLSQPIPIRVLGAPGDLDGDGVVASNDYAVWADSYGAFSVAGYGGDANRDAVVNAADYTVWRDAAQQPAAGVPEPLSTSLATCAALVGLARLEQRRRHLG